ncbi:hypothetical protein MMP74_14765 [Acinetobacter sp. NIPH 1869]|uniref:phage neck terminator protein n=1 Tax=Acinetobacter higginsii TaxID=70347 RepID=UPI001F4ACEAB|nr:hypothetical protein [Acinetobacter higginsii]MCH7305623.1 hypothetical protein [Acinetobacter higginsii]
MTEEQQKKFRLLVLDLLALPDGAVRPADITQPIEGRNYILVQLSKVVPVGQPMTRHENEIQHIYQNSELTLTLDFFGPDAFTFVNTLPFALKSSSGVYGLDDLGLGFLGTDPVQNLSALELDRITRYQVNYHFSMVSNFSTQLSTLDSVAICSQVNQISRI